VNRPNFADNPTPGGNRNNRPTQSVSPAQNHSPQPNNNWSAPPTRQIRQAQVPVVNTRDPQEHNAISVPAQRPSSPANNYSSPTPTAPAPNHDNRTYSPRAWEQVPPPQPPRPNTYNPGTPAVTPAPHQGQSSAPEASHHNAPAAAPAQPQPQHNQPSSSPPPSSSPRSSGQNRDQGDSDNGPGNGSGRGSRH
jgi:hypothetical protein